MSKVITEEDVDLFQQQVLSVTNELVDLLSKLIDKDTKEELEVEAVLYSLLKTAAFIGINAECPAGVFARLSNLAFESEEKNYESQQIKENDINVN